MTKSNFDAHQIVKNALVVLDRETADTPEAEKAIATVIATVRADLIRSGADVVLVAEIAGHRRLDTTRRCSLPSQADKDAAVEAVLLEI